MQGSAAAETAAALAGPVADMAKAQEEARAREVRCHTTDDVREALMITRSRCSAPL
jgi:hypothetical protein